MILADTDVLIDFLRGHEPTAGRVAAAIEGRVLRTTAVTVFELLAGVRSRPQESAVRTLLAAVPDFPLDTPAAERAAAVRRQLEGAGQAIATADSLIAGIALVRGCALLTRNRRHFERVEGLRLAEA